MKKLALLLGTMLLAIGSAANAAPTYCVSFIGFCDGMTFTQVRDGAAELNGTWQNNDCAGGTTALKGTLSGGIVTIGCGIQTPNCPGGLGWTFKFTIAARTFDMWGDFDGPGGSPPFLNLNNSRFGLTTVDTGNCPFVAPDANALPTWATR